MNKVEILRDALKARHDEILHYQINIDNYERAIVKAKLDAELSEFVTHLKELLRSSRIEQKKSIVIRDVIQDQLEE